MRSTKMKLLVLAVALLASMLGASCLFAAQKNPPPDKKTPPPAAAQTSDAEIHKCIVDKLAASELLKDGGIVTSVKNGEVEMKGNFRTPSHKTSAEGIAKSCHARKTTIRVIPR